METPKTENKVVINVEDYELIATFIQKLTIPFNGARQAIAVTEALGRGQLMEITINPVIPEKGLKVV